MLKKQDFESVGPGVEQESDCSMADENKSSTGGKCLYCLGEAVFWVSMVALAYLLTLTGIGYAIP